MTCRVLLVLSSLSSALLVACGSDSKSPPAGEADQRDSGSHSSSGGSGGSPGSTEAGLDAGGPGSSNGGDASSRGGVAGRDNGDAHGGSTAASGGAAGAPGGGAPGASDGGSVTFDAGTASISTRNVVFGVAPPCIQPTSVPVKILDDGVDTPQYDVLGSVGNRFYAYSRNQLALVTFDAAGTKVSSSVLGVAAAATEGTTVQALLSIGEDLSLEVYDAALGPVNGPTPIATGSPYAITLAARQDATLASWTLAGAIHGKVLSFGAAPEFDFPISGPAAACRTRALPDGDGFAMVFACAGTPTSVTFVHIDVSGKASVNDVIAVADAPLELVDVEPSGTGFFGLFQQVSARRAVLLHWDAAGTLDAAPRGFGDVLQAYGIAQAGTAVALAIQAADETSTIVRLDASGAPTSDAPTCLDSALPGAAVAITGRPDGFVAFVRYGNGSEWLLQLPN